MATTSRNDEPISQKKGCSSECYDTLTKYIFLPLITMSMT